jgi:1,4-dihydroxy-2-naphthoate octaprenyltransferase
MGLLITAILVVNNLRDIKTDSQAGKRTLAVRLGIQGTRVEYLLCLLFSYIVPGVMWGLGMVSISAALVLVSVPMAISLVRSIWKGSGSGLNQVLEGTGRLVLIYSFLFSIGVIIPVFLQ